MKLRVYLVSSDNDFGTNSSAFGTEREADDDYLEQIGSDRKAFEKWLKKNPDGDIFDFKDTVDVDFMDTYNCTSDVVDVPLCEQKISNDPAVRAAELSELLARAQQLTSYVQPPAPKIKQVVKFGEDRSNPPRTFKFSTEAERAAFIKGVESMDGWASYELY